MDNGTILALAGPAANSSDVLAELLKTGAQRLLADAIEAEVESYIQEHAHLRDAEGRRLIVRNGSMPERHLETPIGSLRVNQPRVNDRRVDEAGERERFSSKILPPYLRRTRSVDDLVPWLYLRGISTSDFTEFLQKLTGSQTATLSSTTVVRLKEVWQKDYEAWSKRSLVGKQYVYFWVDGIHVNVRLTDERQCLLVIIGATMSGEKELIAVHDGVRESAQSWKEVLLDLKSRGLEHAPRLAIGDGALGFWSALPKVFSSTRAQRCWFHKTGNVLNYLPKGTQPQAKRDIQAIWMAETKVDAEKAFDLFEAKYGAKYDKAVACLKKDRDELLAFYDFPAEHWRHVRTTNPIESTFATVRLRHRRTKGSGSRLACLTMMFKLAQLAESHWRKLNGSELMTDVILGVQFKDGIKVAAA